MWFAVDVAQLCGVVLNNALAVPCQGGQLR